MTRTAEHFVHGLDGPIAIVSGRACLYLFRHAGLDKFRQENRGKDAELDVMLDVMLKTARDWQHRERDRGSDVGTSVAQPVELRAESGQEEGSLYSTKQAASLAGCSQRAIVKAIKDDRLKGMRLDGAGWLINRGDLELYMTRRAQGS